MAAPARQYRAHVVLEAVWHATNANIASLRHLRARHSDALKLELTLRILLTFLPEGTEPALYTGFLHELSDGQPDHYDDVPPGSPSPLEEALSENEARLRVRSLHLEPLVDDDFQIFQDADPITLFLLRQARKIDSETGSLALVSELLETFVDHSETLRTWMISTLLPLLRIEYEYYPNSEQPHTLRDFERLDESVGIQSLLSYAAHRSISGDKQEAQEEVCRDLRGLVGPWMYGERTRKRRKLNHRSRRKSSITSVRPSATDEETNQNGPSSGWSNVNEWLLNLSLRDLPWSVKVIEQWNGPGDVDYGDWGAGCRQLNDEELRAADYAYAQTGLAVIYSTNESSQETIMSSDRILRNVAARLDLREPPDNGNLDLKRTATRIISGISREYLDSVSPVHLLHNSLLRPQNPLTKPTDSAMALLDLFNASCYKLSRLGDPKSIRNVAELCIFATADDQWAELRKMLHILKAGTLNKSHWDATRRQMLWLRNWEQQTDTVQQIRGVFSKIPETDLERELLRAMLDVTGNSGHERQNSPAVEIYCTQNPLPLPMATVESTVMSAILSHYDAASNGNRTIGQMLKASNILNTFQDFFPDSAALAQTSALLSATHAMSSYRLVLQHDVLLRPVNVRAHKDPISLIGKILDQNKRSYAQLDRLLDIGQHLVAAGLPQDARTASARKLSKAELDQEAITARRRILQMAIEAALKEDDFDTAYSYVVTRLPSMNQLKSTVPSEQAQDVTQDDISWRAAYQVGKSEASADSSPILRRLEQREELLSQALLLAPVAALSDILVTWQKCEQDLNAEIAREAAQEDEWDDKGDRKVPGGFGADLSPLSRNTRNATRSAVSEEAPVGLFDVARGAAAALRKNAFPLRGAQKEKYGFTKAAHNRPLSTVSVGSSDEGSVSGAGGHERVRKRDMVSNMVTGGLASGIGWVIGESESLRRSLYTESSLLGAPPVRQE